MHDLDSLLGPLNMPRHLPCLVVELLQSLHHKPLLCLAHGLFAEQCHHTSPVACALLGPNWHFDFNDINEFTSFSTELYCNERLLLLLIREVRRPLMLSLPKVSFPSGPFALLAETILSTRADGKCAACGVSMVSMLWTHLRYVLLYLRYTIAACHMLFLAMFMVAITA